jgi:hypothetical protein
MMLNMNTPKDGAQTLYIRHNTHTLHDISQTYNIHLNKHTPPPTNTLYRYTSLPNPRLG